MISVNICRITPDREYLEFNVEAPTGYIFENLYIWEYTDADAWVVSNTTKVLNSYLDKANNMEIKRISIDEATLNGASLYYLQFEAKPESGTGDTYTANAVVVDLSQNYFTKVRMITEKDNSGINLDKLLNLHIYENCLKSAIALERWEDVNYYYSLIVSLIANNIIISL